MDDILISSIPDNNIFHILVFDILTNYRNNYNNIYIYKNNIDTENQCQKWRKFVMEKIYNTKVEYVDYLNSSQPNNKPLYDCWKFIKFQPYPQLINLFKNLNSNQNGQYILLNQRKNNNRYLYDYDTCINLQDYLNLYTFKLPFVSCCFDEMTVEEQHQICSKAAIFISVHNAGCTNLIFTPTNCPLIEFNFRTHWYCDPVCDDHMNNKISINKKCNGNLQYYPEYHKADYHNLCHLLGKKYVEIDPVEYGGKFIDNNPINKKRIYVDGEKLVDIINSLI